MRDPVCTAASNGAAPITQTPTAAAKQYVQAGLVLVAFDRGSKGPRHKGWNQPENCISTLEQAANLYGNIGIAHVPSRTCCLDVDDLEWAIRYLGSVGINLQALVDAPDACSWTSGRLNRIKILYRLPDGVDPLPTRMFKADGFELRCATAAGLTVQDVLPPSIHPDTGKPYTWSGPRDFWHIPEIPADLLAFWQSLITARPVTTGAGTAPVGMGYEDLEAKLDPIKAAQLGYDDWLHVGMALHHETGGADVGLDLWDAWSQHGGKKYKGRAELESKWAGFTLDHENPITLRSLEWLAGPADYRAEYEVLPKVPSPPLRFLVTDGRITDAEWEAAPEPPRQIVHQLLLQDACGFVAPGGTGKTTLAIAEYIHIILERPLWGRRIVKPGPIALLTAEDSRQVTIDRLKWCMDALRLTPTEQRRVRNNFDIDDISLKSVKLVEACEHGKLKATALQDELIAKYHNRGLSVLHLDPASLLGPGEAHGNDGGAAMNQAMRRIAIELRCCVQLINHVSQAVARGQILDQFAARGPTAIVDNSRGQRQMVRLKRRELDYDGTKYHVPTEAISDEDIQRGRLLMILVHKLSYVEVDPTPIFIARHGYEFLQLPHKAQGNAREKTVNQENQDMETIAGFILKEAANDRRHSRESISGAHRAKLGGLTRQRVRDLIDEGVRIGRFTTAGLSGAEIQGSKTHYLVVVDSDDIDHVGS